VSSSDYPKGNTGDPVFELNLKAMQEYWIPRKLSELRRMTKTRSGFWRMTREGRVLEDDGTIPFTKVVIRIDTFRPH